MNKLIYLTIGFLLIVACSKDEHQVDESNLMTLNYKVYNGQIAISDNTAVSLLQNKNESKLLPVKDSLFYCNRIFEDSIRLRQTLKYEMDGDSLFKAFYLDFVFHESYEKLEQIDGIWQYKNKSELYNKLHDCPWSKHDEDLHLVYWTCEDQLILRPEFIEGIADNDFALMGLHSNGFCLENEDLEIATLTLEEGVIKVSGSLHVYLKQFGFPFWITHEINNCEFKGEF